MLKELIDSNKIKHSKVKKYNTNIRKGKCFPCLVSNTTICYIQVISLSTFKSQQINKPYTIFHEVICSSVFVTYVMEYALYQKQYVRKSKTSFRIKLNNHRKHVKELVAILACKHIVEKNDVSSKHAKFIIIDKLMNTTKSKSILRQIMIEKENLWIYSSGLNQLLSI